MKKYLTLKNVVLFAGALLTILAFFFAFGIKITNYSGNITITNVVIGTPRVTDGSKTEIARGATAVHAGAPIFGIILMLLAGLGAVAVRLFVNKPWGKWVVLGLAAVIVVGAVLVFCVKDSYIVAKVNYMIKEGGFSSEDKASLLADARSLYGDLKFAGAAFTGIVGLVAASATGVSEFLPDKKLGK